MNAHPTAPTAPAAPRFDRKFIEDNQLIERYLDHKLPPKGARELENWCRENPEYIEGLKLAEHAEASLRLLEAMGRPMDLSEPKTPWWQRPYVIIGSGVVSILCLVALWALYGKLGLVESELDDARVRLSQGSLVQPGKQIDARVVPDRTAGTQHASLVVNRNVAQLVDLHIDVGFTKAMLFRLIVDKQDQGRALVVSNLSKDSNGELRLTFNTSGFAAGIYSARIESLGPHDTVNTEGWLTLDVR